MDVGVALAAITIITSIIEAKAPPTSVVTTASKYSAKILKVQA